MKTDLPVGFSEAEIARLFSQGEWGAKFPPVLTPQQAADLFQVSVKTLYFWRASGRLTFACRKSGRHIRFLRDRLLKWFFNDGQDTVVEPPPPDPVSKKLFGGTITLFRRKRKWWVSYRFAGKGYKRSLRTQDEVEAHKRAAVIEQQLRCPQPVASKPSPTIGEAVSLYLKYVETEGRTPKTVSRYRYILARIQSLAEWLHLTRLDQLDMSFVDSFHQRRKKEGVAPKTLHHETTLLKQLINFAIRRDLLERNPLRALKLKTPKPTPQPFWTRPQLDVILRAAAGDQYLPIFRLLSETGMRIAEAKYLTWADIDFDNRVLLIQPKKIGPGADDYWKPKTGDQRAVPLAPEILEMLRDTNHRSRWVFLAPPCRRCPNGDRPVNDRNVLTHLKAILKKVGLPGKLHTFRHSFISLALVRGVPEAVVRQWVGHVDAEILKHYTHIADKESQRYMQGLFSSDTQQG